MGEPKIKPESTKIITGKCRASYARLFHADPETGKYSVTLLIPKSDRKTLADIEAAREAAIVKKWPTKRPMNLHNTLHDGDGVRDDGEPYGPECVGHMILRVSTKTRPGLVDRQCNEIIDPDELQSGDYIRASIVAGAYDTSGNRGVTFYLNNVQCLAKGEPLGSHSRAADEFSVVEDEDDDSAW